MRRHIEGYRSSSDSRGQPPEEGTPFAPLPALPVSSTTQERPPAVHSVTRSVSPAALQGASLAPRPEPAPPSLQNSSVLSLQARQANIRALAAEISEMVRGHRDELARNERTRGGVTEMPSFIEDELATSTDMNFFGGLQAPLLFDRHVRASPLLESVNVSRENSWDILRAPEFIAHHNNLGSRADALDGSTEMAFLAEHFFEASPSEDSFEELPVFPAFRRHVRTFSQSASVDFTGGGPEGPLPVPEPAAEGFGRPVAASSASHNHEPGNLSEWSRSYALDLLSISLPPNRTNSIAEEALQSSAVGENQREERLLALHANEPFVRVPLSSAPDPFSPGVLAGWGEALTPETETPPLILSDPPYERLFSSDVRPIGMQRLPESSFFSWPPAMVNFSDLADAIGGWVRLAAPDARPIDSAQWSLDHYTSMILKTFLERLRETSDFKMVRIRPHLAARVYALLRAMEEERPLRAQILDLIEQALSSCADRIIWTMNRAELLIRVKNAERSSTDGRAVRELVLGLMRLEVVHTEARRAIQNMQEADEIEVYLAYEVNLRETLNLPVGTQTMLFEACADLTPAHFENARLAALAIENDPLQVQAWLQGSAIWQHHLRRQAANAWNWDALERQHVSHDLSALRCPLTLDLHIELSQPLVWLDGHACVVFEAASFLTHWVEHGNEPTTRRQVDLSALIRPL